MTVCPEMCPGSDEAASAGCRCPRMDNWRGQRHGMHIVIEGCAVHWPYPSCGGVGCPCSDDCPAATTEENQP